MDEVIHGFFLLGAGDGEEAAPGRGAGGGGKGRGGVERRVERHLVGVKVEDEELGLLGPVAGADGADELGGVGADTPDDAAAAAALQGYQVADEVA